MARTEIHTSSSAFPEKGNSGIAVTDQDIAWFAGWLCADGSIRRGGNGGSPSIRFVICDKDPLERFARLFGGKVYGPFSPSGLGKRPRYEWKIAGKQINPILERCLPWLSDRYRQRALLAMKYPYREHLGRKLTPNNVIAIRQAIQTGAHGIGKALALRYGVSNAQISAIKLGRSW